MKKFLVNSLAALALFIAGNTLNSCDRVKDAVEDVSVPVPFPIDLNIDQTDTPFFSVPTIGNFYDYPPIKLDIDVDAKIKEKYPKLGVDNLRSVKLNSFSITNTGSTGLGDVNFSAITDAELYLQVSGLPDVLVATVSGNTNPTVLTFTPKSDAELINYFKSKQQSLKIRYKSNKISVGKINMKLSPSFKVSVGV